MSRALDSTDTLALAALVVALVALLNTISQVLQQYFATADGYRRCSSSVMGDWARFTRRRFKWKELRFETIFVTPVIFLDVAYDMKLAQERENSPVVILDGSDEMSKWPGLKEVGHHEMRWNRFSHHHHHHSAPADLEKPKPVHSRTFSKPSNTGIKKFLRENTPLMPPESQLERFMALDVDPKGHRLDNEPVTWISLMQSLQRYSASLQGAGLTVLQDVGSGSLRRGRILTPAARISKKSWDFMPPEITKPLALSNLRDIVIIVQILGCKWTNFKPEEGNIRAEGDGILVTSAEVRSLGTVVSFTKTDKRIEELRELHGLIYSPFEGAVNLGFGIIQSDLLSGETYKIFSLDDCYETLNRLSSAVRDFSTMPKLVMQTSKFPTFYSFLKRRPLLLLTLVGPD
ncbi:hypothetical protein EJ08DRAFT_699667 [Tothia fuscella]|uniref:Uncharacterized protein n=1 Tax=Tothia fuscella TaxID=1048955 RepID=A0A9P4NM56_9PEZI|nr:hypothetical protein EJ08DRAFT_699667 [Tothia fuscella]